VLFAVVTLRLLTTIKNHSCPKTDLKNLLVIENVLLMGDRKVAQTKRTPIKRRRTKAWYDVQAYSVN
jgi:hypothetical protein